MNTSNITVKRVKPQFNLAMQQVTPFKMITTRDDRSLKHVRVILA